MQVMGPNFNGIAGNRPAFALGVNTGMIITKVSNPSEARALPAGTVIGDQAGGLTFSDNIAAILEQRSLGGWQEMQIASGEIWTVIVLNR
jgi:hypothetical protein